MLILKDLEVDGYERVVEGIDESCGLHCIIAVHNTALGPALGGTRFYPYTSREDAITDVLRLAEGMTYKSAVAEIGLGGGKSVILGDPNTMKTPELLRSFGRAVESLGGLYICAEDMGTDTADLAVIRETTRYAVGLDVEGSSGDPGPFTAWGVYRGTKAVAQELFHSDRLEGKHVAILGVGSVGKRLADHLFWEGAKLTLADINSAKVKYLAGRYGAQIVSPNEILSVECDIFAPCAIGGLINPRTIPQLRCKAIAGAANNQLLHIEDGDLLRNKGILYAPDFVINGGGIINVAFELDQEGYCAVNAKQKVDRIYDTLLAIFKLAREKRMSTSVAAEEIARQKVRQGIGRREHEVCFHA
ncbi:MAG: Glu/Leu/Phe/Val dehydrogenase [Chlamydiia bacterium]|nr:Glu/Leu/Phe/Val dehydrogenase [Chlamydiia bacterium]